MGLSRNKVAVSEGAAGSPPFYGERVTEKKFAVTKFRLIDADFSKSELMLFNFQGTSFLEKKSVL